MKINELKKIRQGMEDAARGAGKILLRHQKELKSLKISNKKAAGVASNADFESEKYLLKKLGKTFPKAKFLAEEDAYQRYGSKIPGKDFLNEEWLWIIDPLDGTNNFLNGIDYYVVALSLCHFGEPIVGLIYRPTNGDSYSAIKGDGFRHKLGKAKNWSRPIKESKSKKKINEGIFVTGFATEKGIDLEIEFDVFRTILKKSRAVRRMGSAALDLCHVASGIFDGFWERGLAPWDVAASGLICKEAGVAVSNYEGSDFHPFQTSILAARKPLDRELRKLVLQK